jgi:surface protein
MAFTDAEFLQATQLALQRYALHTSTINNGDVYTPPDDWLDIESLAQDGEITLLLSDMGHATYSLKAYVVFNGYTVDWGDGTIENALSNQVVTHTYELGDGVPCSRGYTTFKARIYGQTHAVTEFSFVEFRTPSGVYMAQPALACVIKSLNIYLSNFYTVNEMFEFFIYKSSPDLSRTILTGTSALSGCTSLISAKIDSLGNANYIFDNCTNLKYVEITRTEYLSSAIGMFRYCNKLESLIIDTCNALYDASNMFNGCKSLRSIDFEKFPTVNTYWYMCNGCISLTSINIPSTSSSSNTSKGMLYGCTALIDVNIEHIIYGDATDMLAECTKLKNITINGAQITNTTAMFQNCTSLETIDISQFKKVTIADRMFKGCVALSSLNASNFGQSVTSSIGTRMADAFDECYSLTSISLPLAKLKTLGVAGTTFPSIVNNQTTSISFNAGSLFNYNTSPIDISYNNLDATGLNSIFTLLPTVSGRSINITGCIGAATCNRSIATAKGWTVVG